MTVAAIRRAPALLLAAVAMAALFAASGYTASAQGTPTAKNCDPPPDGVWYVEGEHVVCVGGEITLSRLKIWEASTIEFHDVDLYLDTANTPEGTATVAVGADLEGYVIPSKLIIKDSYVKALDPSLPQRIDMLSHSELEFIDSALDGLGHGITVGPTNHASITNSIFKDAASSIIDFGAPDIVVQGNFFDQVDSPIYTQGTPVIEGNTMVQCVVAIELRGDGAHPVIRENTITSCSTGISQVASESPQEDIYYNDVFGNCDPTAGGSNVRFYGAGANNWWGGNPPPQESVYGLYHCTVESDRPPNFDYTPWLSSPRHPERLPTPAIASLPSSVVRGESIAFDASGSQPSTEFGFDLASYEWSFGDGNAATGDQVSHAYQDLGTYSVRLHVKDEKGLGHFVEESVQVVNQDPEVDVSLASGFAGEDIVATVEATDPDGDSPVVSLSWLQNGGETSVTQEVVPGDLVRSGDTWRIRVYVTDSDGATVQESRDVEIPNRSPSIETASIQPSEPVATQDLLIEATASDPDEDDVDFSYVWYRNGVLQSDLTGSQVPSSRVHPTDTWRVTVTATDAQGATDSATQEVTIPNREPKIMSIAVVPEEPRRGEALQATVAVDDPDQDPVTVSYAWYEGGTYSGIAAATVPGEELQRGRDWHVVVTASDGYDEVTEASDVVTVQNTAPEVVSLSLDASEAGQALEAAVEAVDADGDDVGLEYAWRQNGQSRSDLTGPVVSGSEVVSGDEWVLTVTPSDDALSGESVSVKAVIGNHAPVIESLTVSPVEASASMPLEVAVEVSDQDGDDVGVEYAWLQNGDATDLNGKAVPVDRLSKGDSWRVRVTATDGMSEAKQLSAAVVIQNTPPEVLSVTVEPEEPLAGDVLQLALEASDVDADELTITWVLPDGTQVPGMELEAMLAAGVHEIAYHVSDGQATVSGSVSLTVEAIDPVPDEQETETTHDLSNPGIGEDDDADDSDVQSKQATSQDVGADDASTKHGGSAAKEAPLPVVVLFVALVVAFARRRR